MWVLGDQAIAKISRNSFAKVVIVKDENGVFWGEKFLYMDSEHPTTSMCIYVKIIRTGLCLWVPQDALRLGERARPFYGQHLTQNKENIPPDVTNVGKHKEHEDLVVPFEGPKQPNILAPDKNLSHSGNKIPTVTYEPENAFQQFVRRVKSELFEKLVESQDLSDDICMEKDDEMSVDENEIEHYLNSCWRYLTLRKVHQPKITYDQLKCPEVPVLYHITWCLVCGLDGDLLICTQCPGAYHRKCRPDWLLTLLHRKNGNDFVPKVHSKKRSGRGKMADWALCPSCYYGPGVGLGDIVWHKLPGCPWWPAKVLLPGALPTCLVGRNHSPDELPLQYYDTLNYSWGQWRHICLVVPNHGVMANTFHSEQVSNALMDACDDYIRFYLI